MIWQRLALGVYVACFSVGTYTHLLAVRHHGWRPHPFAPDAMNVFWTALTVLDPAVVLALLSGWRRSGLSLALAIMVADVAVNSYAHYGLGISGFEAALQMQTAFAGFVLGSITFLWPRKEKPGALG